MKYITIRRLATLSLALFTLTMFAPAHATHSVHEATEDERRYWYLYIDMNDQFSRSINLWDVLRDGSKRIQHGLRNFRIETQGQFGRVTRTQGHHRFEYRVRSDMRPWTVYTDYAEIHVTQERKKNFGLFKVTTYEIQDKIILVISNGAHDGRRGGRSEPPIGFSTRASDSICTTNGCVKAEFFAGECNTSLSNKAVHIGHGGCSGRQYRFRQNTEARFTRPRIPNVRGLVDNRHTHTHPNADRPTLNFGWQPFSGGNHHFILENNVRSFIRVNHRTGWIYGYAPPAHDEIHEFTWVVADARGQSRLIDMKLDIQPPLGGCVTREPECIPDVILSDLEFSGIPDSNTDQGIIFYRGFERGYTFPGFAEDGGVYTLTGSIPGLTFDANTRRLSGTPTENNVYELTYSGARTNNGVVEPAEPENIKTFNLFVVEHPYPPQFDVPEPPQELVLSLAPDTVALEEGDTMPKKEEEMPAATGGVPPYQYAVVPADAAQGGASGLGVRSVVLNNPGLPVGITFDPVERKISVDDTVAEPGEYQLVYRITDSAGGGNPVMTVETADDVGKIVQVTRPDNVFDQPFTLMVANRENKIESVVENAVNTERAKADGLLFQELECTGPSQAPQ